MARNGRIGASKTSGGRSKARGYTIRGKHGRIDYVGVTIPGKPGDDLPPGTWSSVLKQSQRDSGGVLHKEY